MKSKPVLKLTGSPLPVSCVGQETAKCVATIRDAQGRWFADCVKDHAPQIVLACNMHDELVAALKRLLEHTSWADKDYEASIMAATTLRKAGAL